MNTNQAGFPLHKLEEKTSATILKVSKSEYYFKMMKLNPQPVGNLKINVKFN